MDDPRRARMNEWTIMKLQHVYALLGKHFVQIFCRIVSVLPVSAQFQTNVHLTSKP